MINYPKFLEQETVSNEELTDNDLRIIFNLLLNYSKTKGKEIFSRLIKRIKEVKDNRIDIFK